MNAFSRSVFAPTCFAFSAASLPGLQLVRQSAEPRADGGSTWPRPTRPSRIRRRPPRLCGTTSPPRRTRTNESARRRDRSPSAPPRIAGRLQVRLADVAEIGRAVLMMRMRVVRVRDERYTKQDDCEQNAHGNLRSGDLGTPAKRLSDGAELAESGFHARNLAEGRHPDKFIFWTGGHRCHWGSRCQERQCPRLRPSASRRTAAGSLANDGLRHATNPSGRTSDAPVSVIPYAALNWPSGSTRSLPTQ